MQSAGTFAIAAQLVVDENPEHVHVDLSQVTFIDSSGARGVYALVSLAAEQGVGCSIIGREDLFSRRPGDRESIVVWSGSTTRQIDLPPATARWSTDKSGNGQPGEISVGNEFAR